MMNQITPLSPTVASGTSQILRERQNSESQPFLYNALVSSPLKRQRRHCSNEEVLTQVLNMYKSIKSPSRGASTIRVRAPQDSPMKYGRRETSKTLNQVHSQTRMDSASSSESEDDCEDRPIEVHSVWDDSTLAYNGIICLNQLSFFDLFRIRAMCDPQVTNMQKSFEKLCSTTTDLMAKRKRVPNPLSINRAKKGSAGNIPFSLDIASVKYYQRFKEYYESYSGNQSKRNLPEAYQRYKEKLTSQSGVFRVKRHFLENFNSEKEKKSLGEDRIPCSQFRQTEEIRSPRSSITQIAVSSQSKDPIVKGYQIKSMRMSPVPQKKRESVQKESSLQIPNIPLTPFRNDSRILKIRGSRESLDGNSPCVLAKYTSAQGISTSSSRQFPSNFSNFGSAETQEESPMNTLELNRERSNISRVSFWQEYFKSSSGTSLQEEPSPYNMNFLGNSNKNSNNNNNQELGFEEMAAKTIKNNNFIQEKVNSQQESVPKMTLVNPGNKSRNGSPKNELVVQGSSGSSHSSFKQFTILNQQFKGLNFLPKIYQTSASKSILSSSDKIAQIQKLNSQINRGKLV